MNRYYFVWKFYLQTISHKHIYHRSIGKQIAEWQSQTNLQYKREFDQVSEKTGLWNT